jgi:hypothetical protein
MPRLMPSSSYPKSGKPNDRSDRPSPGKPRRPLERSGLKPPPASTSPSSPSSSGEDLYPMSASSTSLGSSNPIGEEVIQSQPLDPIDPMGTSTGAPEDVPEAAFSQSQAGYTSGQDRCGGCTSFIQPSACKYVQGVIEAEGSCPLHSNLSGMGGGGVESSLPAPEVEIEIEPMGGVSEEEEV